MPRLTPYPRGFVLSPDPIDLQTLPRHYRASWIIDAWHFAHDPIREPALAVDEATGRFVLVHGTCFAVGDEDAADVTPWLLAKCLRSEGEFLDALDVLAGRHVVVTGDPTSATIYQDAAGARSVYYSPAARLVASHAHLVQDVVPHPPSPPELGATTVTASWDLTPWDGILALLPNHRLDLSSWRTQRFFPRRRNPYAQWPVEQRLDLLEALWHRELDALTAAFDDIAVSVTGGTDSRVVLALSRPHLAALKGFTYTARRDDEGNAWTRSLSRDERLVRQLLDLLPMRHEFFVHGDKSAPVGAELTELLRRNSLGNHGRWLIPHYNRSLPGDDVIHLRGNAFEIARGYYGPTRDNDTVDEVRRVFSEKAAQRLADGSRADLTERQRNHVDSLLERLGYQDELWGYHRLDLFYWEYRCGRWLAEMLNENDVSFDTVMPVNVRAMLEILLSFDLEERAAGVAFAELINRTFPVLNFVGKNDDRNLYEQVRDAEGPSARSDGSAWLEAGICVVEEDGTVLEDEIAPDQADLHLPLRHFVPGRAAARRIGRPAAPGTLTFRFHSPYVSPLAREKFVYRLRVNGRVMAEVDGAAWAEASHVTVHNLGADDAVDLQVAALAAMTRPSWTTATRAHLDHLRFTSREADGPVRVASSNPYTRYPA
ncbi:hypothetical protein ACT4S2_00350 [Kocuria turfanensis]|uniref:hypothetical protein n=1 Tax=Kocuria turfanensis TaxID=388357 RepID=UPI00403638BE